MEEGSSRMASCRSSSNTGSYKSLAVFRPAHTAAHHRTRVSGAVTDVIVDDYAPKCIYVRGLRQWTGGVNRVCVCVHSKIWMGKGLNWTESTKRGRDRRGRRRLVNKNYMPYNCRRWMVVVFSGGREEESDRLLFRPPLAPRSVACLLPQCGNSLIFGKSFVVVVVFYVGLSVLLLLIEFTSWPTANRNTCPALVVLKEAENRERALERRSVEPESRKFDFHFLISLLWCFPWWLWWWWCGVYGEEATPRYLNGERVCVCVCVNSSRCYLWKLVHLKGG